MPQARHAYRAGAYVPSPSLASLAVILSAAKDLKAFPSEGKVPAQPADEVSV